MMKKNRSLKTSRKTTRSFSVVLFFVCFFVFFGWKIEMIMVEIQNSHFFHPACNKRNRNKKNKHQNFGLMFPKILACDFLWWPGRSGKKPQRRVVRHDFTQEKGNKERSLTWLSRVKSKHAFLCLANTIKNKSKKNESWR
jgi:hypothetical protein